MIEDNYENICSELYACFMELLFLPNRDIVAEENYFIVYIDIHANNFVGEISNVQLILDNKDRIAGVSFVYSPLWDSIFSVNTSTGLIQYKNSSMYMCLKCCERVTDCILEAVKLGSYSPKKYSLPCGVFVEGGKGHEKTGC